MLENNPGLPDRYEMPEHETPARRLAEHSAEYLSDSELLSLMLSGTLGAARSLKIARDLMAAYGSFKRITGLSLSELQRVPGIGFHSACAIQSSMELSRRLRQPPPDTRIVLNSPTVVAKFMRDRIGNLQQEEFHALLLDCRHRLIRDCRITIGLLDRSHIHARELFRPAIAESCSRILLAHNHPSGDTSPSPQDIDSNRKLCEAGKIIGIEVLDHVIVGPRTEQESNYYLSFKESKLM